ncbi:sensor histidine kinase [Actinophytocola xanthii]|uniref:histidine kinase n=1 Tax=Actinophytocola xanthii TaxID=1912961 RepID=A0A1Q8CM50_9PSEU|nr:histidine kinase [Actinophytocola xanthii]OLF15425.1 hypothetical protein BU204_21940 [Actinophytocola xanthii]
MPDQARRAALERLLARRPQLVDGGLAVLAAAVALPATVGGHSAPGVLEPGTGVTGAGWLWFVVVHVPLVWRRRSPDGVFWLVLCLSVASVLSGVTGVFLVSVPLCALYAVARYLPPVRLLPVAVAFVLVVGLGWLRDRPAPATLIGIGSLATAIAVTGILVRQRLAYLDERDRRLRAELDHRAMTTVAAERAQIAREVHDIVAHNLAVMVALTEGAAHTAWNDPRRTVEMVDQASAAGRAALGDMRRLVGLLRDGGAWTGDQAREVDLAPQPGLADLDELVGQVRAAGLRVAFTREGPVGVRGSGLGLAVYRVVQEALTNILKHAGPNARAEVRLRSTAEGLELEVVDDGGDRPAPATSSGGNGLVGIAERAAAYGGTVETGPADQGWRVRVRFTGGPGDPP